MLNKIFKLLESPYRYINVAGDTHRVSPLAQAWNRAELKATMAGSTAIAATTAVASGSSLDGLGILFGAAAGYAISRATGSPDIQRMLIGLCYRRMPVIDKQPVGGLVTSPEDMNTTGFLYLAGQENLPKRLRMSALSVFANCAAIAVEKALNLPPFVIALQSVAIGHCLEYTSRGLLLQDRFRRILNEEYVILKNEPAKQQMMEKDQKTVRQGVLAPSAIRIPVVSGPELRF